MEEDVHLALRRLHRLAGSDQERDAGPTPVVDAEAQGGERLGVGSGPHAVFLRVPLVLPADVLRRIGVGDRTEHVEAAILHRGRAARRRLHRHQGQYLQQVVLDDIAQGAHLVVEGAPTLDVDRLRERDLHRLDVVSVPDRFEDLVREAQIHDVLDRLLAQEVVDPVDLILPEHAPEPFVQLAGRREVRSERFLHHHPSPLGQTCPTEGLDDRAEQRRRCREVEDGPRRFTQRLPQPLVRSRVFGVGRDVGEALGESLEDLVVHGPLGLLHRLAGHRAQLIRWSFLPAHADHVARQRASELEPVQGRQGHATPEIARDPEADERVRRRIHRLPPGRHRSPRPDGGGPTRGRPR